MFFHILNIVAPVFLLIVLGYITVSRDIFPSPAVDALMKFAIKIAVPCLLFDAIATMDLESAFNWRLIVAFFTGATVSFALAVILSQRFFKRRPGAAVAVGFSALFSNLVLLGLPVSARAWGDDNLIYAYAIVSIHAPFCYLLGITLMEVLRADGRSFIDTGGIILKEMFSNSLMIGISLGFVANLIAWPIPSILNDSIQMLAQAALPVALFGLGGALTKYTLREELGEVGMISTLSLLVHPAIAWILCHLLGVTAELTRVVVLMAAMAPGVNGYLFASMYQRGQATAASSVLLGTVLSCGSVSVWLWLLV